VARGTAEAKFEWRDGFGVVGEEGHLVHRAEVVEGVRRQDHFDVDIGVTNREIELDETVRTQLADTDEFAGGIERPLAFDAG